MLRNESLVVQTSFLIYFYLFFLIRLKKLREEPYTQAEAERAAGMGSYIPPKTNIEVHTQQVEEDMDWKMTSFYISVDSSE